MYHLVFQKVPYRLSYIQDLYLSLPFLDNILQVLCKIVERNFLTNLLNRFDRRGFLNYKKDLYLDYYLVYQVVFLIQNYTAVICQDLLSQENMFQVLEVDFLYLDISSKIQFND